MILCKKNIVRNVYHTTALVVFVIVLFFIYIIAETDDAPGLIIIGTAINALAGLFLYGLGSLIELTKMNNSMIKNIYEVLNKK